MTEKIRALVVKHWEVFSYLFFGVLTTVVNYVVFAIAAQVSIDHGFGGFVFMDAKNTELVRHYHEKMGAQLLGMPHPYRMFIDEEAAHRLFAIYNLGGE